ncbi:hypothetical protein HZC33_00340 [Candidatus Wolfebacteria bacterium]|nr:hypothetical protein [Candidatus Wolfebacteria bacterium]
MNILNNFFSISGAINCFVAVLFGILVLFKNRNIASNKIFFFFAFSVAFWSFGYWRWLLAQSEQSAILWIKFLTLGSLFIPTFYFHWLISLLEGEKIEKYIKNILYILSAVLTGFLFFSDLVIKNVEVKLIFLYWPNPGILYDIFIAVFTGVIIYSLIFLIKKYFSVSDSLKKRRIFFLLLGSLIGFGGGITNFFLWYNIGVLPYANILVSFGLFFWAYSALRHHLFDINIIATELFVFFIWIAILFEMLIVNNLKEKIFDGGLFLISIIFGIFLVKSVLKEVNQRKEIEKLNDYKTELLSIVAHQIKNPLVIMKDYSSLIGDKTISDPIKIQEAVLKIKNSANKLLDLLNNLLDFGRFEDGKMHYDFERIELNKLLKNIEEDFIFAAQRKNLDLKFESLPGEIFIKGDVHKFNQVFRNLIDNAIKYTKSGFVKIEMIGAKNDSKKEILIKISDSGMGIQKELFENIFKKFVRGGDEKEILGSGLGLYICKEIVSAHNGEIWVESEGSGKGSIFYVKLPLY